MKILELTGDATSRVIETEPPSPKRGEVVIQTARSAICGSEMKTYRGAGIVGGNSGHEAVGTVIALGDGVTSLSLGQRVGVSAMAGCGDCRECEKGHYTWCQSHRFYGLMHAERFIIPARACSLIPADMSWEEAALLTGDGMDVPWHTAKKIDRADIQTILVMGLGPIGLGNVLLQSHLGRRVIGVDIIDYRVDFAKRLGADVSLKAHDSLIDQIMDLTDGTGVDVAIDCAGKPGKAWQTASWPCAKAVLSFSMANRTKKCWRPAVTLSGANCGRSAAGIITFMKYPRCTISGARAWTSGG